MVENRKDSIGPSPVARGPELRKWNQCVNQGDLIDGWLAAVQTKGPWFTRQALHGNRLDQSRLDRCYLSNRGEWVFLMDEMEHYGAASLSDHVPIRISIALEARRQTRSIRSYFKMDAKAGSNPDTMNEVKKAWEEHPPWAKEDRMRWALAWARVRKVLISRKNKDRSELPDITAINRRLERAREKVQVHPSEENKQEFEEARQLARSREQIDVRISRIRSRIKWLHEGEAPSRFFFACVKAKNARENIKVIKLDSGTLVNEEDRILELTEAQNESLDEIPSEVLIEEVVQSLSKDKSQGVDGVIAEMLRAGWDFMKIDCYKMVTQVWRMGRILPKDNRGVIKLISKTEDLELLKN
ncbi:hypothetical protein R1sor_011952 [Riccia sorocarpa]|uniref:Endonuclease/exonuclease/phosphatase domain-containing protein n=1 Tax=Riccia sorocarpa TaxID=122646 RepID=A0ABD3I3P6_9MARC